MHDVAFYHHFYFVFMFPNITATITGLGYRCNIGGTVMYADDMVLLSPPWNALQSMLISTRLEILRSIDIKHQQTVHGIY